MLGEAVILALVGLAGTALGYLFKWLITKDNNDTKEAVAKNHADIEALKQENQRRRLSDQATNQFQSNLLQQIKALQDELSLVRSRCHELEGMNRDNNRRIRDLEDEIARLKREAKMAEIHAFPGGKK